MPPLSKGGAEHSEAEGFLPPPPPTKKAGPRSALLPVLYFPASKIASTAFST